MLSQSFLTGERIEPSDVQRFLANLFIELTDKELENLLKTLPLDGESVEFLGRLRFFYL